jgi:hypothetical protein
MHATRFTAIICPRLGHRKTFIYTSYGTFVGRDSSVGVGTRYGMDGPGIDHRWEKRFFAAVQTGPRTYEVSYAVGTGSISLG